MTPSPESSRDTTIAELHRIREGIVDAFQGDLYALTADAQRRQEASGRLIIRRGKLSQKHRDRSDESDTTQKG